MNADAARRFTTIALPQRLADAIVAHARLAAPHECCGLLLGHDRAIVDAMRAGNVAATPRRTYTIDPEGHFRAIRAARERGLDVIGAYHSHPSSAAVPSPADRRQAFPGFLFLIVGLGSDPPGVTAWQFEAGNFAHVSLVITA